MSPRSKSARVVTFEQFNQALTELAPKRFKGQSQEEALQKLYGLVVGKEPANQGVTVSPAAATDSTVLCRCFEEAKHLQPKIGFAVNRSENLSSVYCRDFILDL